MESANFQVILGLSKGSFNLIEPWSTIEANLIHFNKIIFFIRNKQDLMRARNMSLTNSKILA